MKKAIVLSLVVLLANSVSAFVSAQTLPPPTEKDFTATYDARVRQALATFPDLPGIAIVVIKDDKPVLLRAYGMADKEAALKADTDTLYYIASSTKSFTALAAAMLDQEGKIKFSDPLTKYTPGIQSKNAIPDKITIRDLLTHTSGLRNGALINRLAFTGQIDQSELDRVLAEGTTLNDANFGKYNYTNLGYNIYRQSDGNLMGSGLRFFDSQTIDDSCSNGVTDRENKMSYPENRRIEGLTLVYVTS